MVKKNKGGIRKDSCIIPFHTYSHANLVASTNQILVQPSASLSPRCFAEADAWAHFRVKMLKFRLHPFTRTGDLLVGYVGGVQDTSPASLTQVGELLPSAILGMTATVPTEWVNVTGSELAGPFPWYKSVPGTADPTEESPGVIVLYGGGTDGFTLEIKGVIEFKTAVATGNTPLERERILKCREERVLGIRAAERDRILKVLAPAAAITAQGKTV